LRPGAITLAALRAVAGDVRPARAGAGGVALPRTPGSTPAHYAPRTPLLLLAGDALGAAAQARAAGGARIGVLALAAAPPGLEGSVHWLAAGADPVRFGHDLYARLRDLDRLGLDQLLVESVPAGEAWDAVRDRLMRAAAGSSASTAPATDPTDDNDNGDLP
ncbi:MAG: hypothetical protein RL684_953, partial [Pseudomonadota bacterium]